MPNNPPASVDVRAYLVASSFSKPSAPNYDDIVVDLFSDANGRTKVATFVCRTDVQTTLVNWNGRQYNNQAPLAAVPLILEPLRFIGRRGYSVVIEWRGDAPPAGFPMLRVTRSSGRSVAAGRKKGKRR
jgi:hypothetical protein